MKENNILRRRVIEAKFGTVDRGWYSRVLTRLHRKAVEKEINMERVKFKNTLDGRLSECTRIILLEKRCFVFLRVVGVGIGNLYYKNLSMAVS